MEMAPEISEKKKNKKLCLVVEIEEKGGVLAIIDLSALVGLSMGDQLPSVLPQIFMLAHTILQWGGHQMRTPGAEPRRARVGLP